MMEAAIATPETTYAAAYKAEPTHHLSDDMLLDYVTGSLDEATSLIVATHLTLCTHCRARAAELDMIGGAVLLDIDPVPTGADAFEQLMERIEVKGAERPLLSRPAANDNPILPRVLQTYLEGDAESIQWNSIGMGVETSPISLGNTSKRAFMLKVPEGRAVPEHTHEGIELVLVLAGSYQDEIGNFGRGDLAISDSSVRHKPVADRGADCICLVVTDAPVRLTGMLGKILNLFVKV